MRFLGVMLLLVSQTKKEDVVDYLDEQPGDLFLTKLFESIANGENSSFFFFFFFFSIIKRKRGLKDGV